MHKAAKKHKYGISDKIIAAAIMAAMK